MDEVIRDKFGEGERRDTIQGRLTFRDCFSGRPKDHGRGRGHIVWSDEYIRYVGSKLKLSLASASSFPDFLESRPDSFCVTYHALSGILTGFRKYT